MLTVSGSKRKEEFVPLNQGLCPECMDKLIQQRDRHKQNMKQGKSPFLGQNQFSLHLKWNGIPLSDIEHEILRILERNTEALGRPTQLDYIVDNVYGPTFQDQKTKRHAIAQRVYILREKLEKAGADKRIVTKGGGYLLLGTDSALSVDQGENRGKDRS